MAAGMVSEIESVRVLPYLSLGRWGAVVLDRRRHGLGRSRQAHTLMCGALSLACCRLTARRGTRARVGRVELNPGQRIYVGAWTRIVVRKATDDEKVAFAG